MERALKFEFKRSVPGPRGVLLRSSGSAAASKKDWSSRKETKKREKKEEDRKAIEEKGGDAEQGEEDEDEKEDDTVLAHECAAMEVRPLPSTGHTSGSDCACATQRARPHQVQTKPPPPPPPFQIQTAAFFSSALLRRACMHSAGGASGCTVSTCVAFLLPLLTLWGPPEQELRSIHGVPLVTASYPRAGAGRVALRRGAEAPPQQR